jgi:hypothetical protein
MAYTLTYSRETVSEGQSVVISLNGTGLPNGTLVPFTITGSGISALDFIGLSSLSGNFVIQNDKSKITLKLAQDLLTEGTESFILRLTGPGRTESIGITVLDTSTASVNVANIFIKPDKETINEGETVVFNVRGEGVPIGTSVPYVLSGIQNADLYNLPVSGNIIFAANSTYDTTANLTLTLLLDNVTEGPENIVMLIYPDFPYSLQISGTTLVQDVSTYSSPQIRVENDKQTVVEGGNVTFTVFAQNINAGTNVYYRIIPWTSWDQPSDLFPSTNLEANDFVGLDSLYGNFPPLYEPEANATTNVTSITFTTYDDYIFEPTEYFYLGVFTDAGVGSGSGIVGIQDSGNTYLRSYSTFSGDATVKFLEPATLAANIGGAALGISKWKNTDSQVSDDMVIQGKSPYATDSSAVFYQPFSYVIRSSKSIDEWAAAVKGVLHPAGFAIFSEINNETDPKKVNYAGVKAVEEIEIFTRSPLSVDFSSYSANVTSSSLTVDTVYTLNNLPSS